MPITNRSEFQICLAREYHVGTPCACGFDGNNPEDIAEAQAQADKMKAAILRMVEGSKDAA